MRKGWKRLRCLLQIIILMVVMAGCQQKAKKQEDAKPNGTGDVFQTLGIQESELSDTGITAVFNITLTEPIPEGTKITMGADLNKWYPLTDEWVAKKLDDTHYQCVIVLDTSAKPADSVNLTMAYKWTLQDGTFNLDTMWDMVEIAEGDLSMNNRSIEIHAGTNVYDDTIYNFKDKNKKFSEYKYSTVTTGEYETVTLTDENLEVDSERDIFIWVPESYDPNNTDIKYPVLYMHDGLGLFDASISMNGEWEVDEAITECMKNGYEGCIVVGIASSDNRELEMSPTFTDQKGQAEYYAEFIVDIVKPYIDSNYNTKPDRENTGIGGCSMGGLESLYMGMKYPDIFGFELNFSPCLLGADELITAYMDTCDFTSQPVPKIYLYAGGVGTNNDLEARLTKYPEFVKENLLKRGYPEEKINTLIDMTQGHSNQAWCKYFPVAFKWLVGIE